MDCSSCEEHSHKQVDVFGDQVVTEGPHSRPLLVLKRCNDEFLVFDGDTHTGSGLEAGGLDPSSGELHPRKGGRLLAQMEGQACRFLIALGFLDGDRPLYLRCARPAQSGDAR